MEKGNALGGVSAASTTGPGLVESATTVTSVVTGMGTTAGETVTKAIADKAAEAAIDETRAHLHGAAPGDEPQARPDGTES